MQLNFCNRTGHVVIDIKGKYLAWEMVWGSDLKKWITQQVSGGMDLFTLVLAAQIWLQKQQLFADWNHREQALGPGCTPSDLPTPTHAPCHAEWNWQSQAHPFRGTERAKAQSPTPAMSSWGHKSKTRYSTLTKTSDFGLFFICKRHTGKIIYFLFFFDEHINNFQIIQSGVGVT